MNKDKSTEKLFKLMQENPKLPVVPMVDSDVAAGYAWNIGRLEEVEIDEYLIADGNVYTKSADDIQEVLEAAYGSLKAGIMEDEEAERVYQQLPWQRAILLYIRAIWV